MMSPIGSRILLVDDHPGQLNVLSKALGDIGHNVVGCSTMKEAVDTVQKSAFAVAVLNVQTPNETGIEVFGLLLKLNSKVRIVLSPGFQSFLPEDENLQRAAIVFLENSETMTALNHIHREFLASVSQQMNVLETNVAAQTRALDEQQAYFHQLVQHIQEVFWIALPDHSQVLFMSPRYEAVWGRSVTDLLDHSFHLWDAVHPQDQEQVLTSITEGETTGFHAEFRILRPDHTVRWLKAHTFPILNSSGDVIRMVGIAEDTTEQKRAEETLIKTERQFRQSSRMEAIGTLAGGIAHDFNNILTAVLGYTELGLASVPKDSRTHRNLQEVLTAGHRAKHLVLQILAFSRQSGQGKAPTPIHMVIQEALKLLRASIPSTIEIDQALTTEASVLADSTQLHQVVVNLGTNAEYAMREKGGRLEVRLEDCKVDEEKVRAVSGLQVGPHIRLTMEDSGTGMPPDVLERMFDPFFTTKPIGEGSGMGLAVVHGIVTNHGGAVLVDSIVGKGTKIEVYLPTLSSQTWDGSDDQSPMPQGKETILFVDDEETIVHLGKELLSKLGYTVEIYTDSQKALNTFRNSPERFDLVITDQTMPRLTGEALSRELLRIRPELPIILCTGFSHTMSAEQAKALGIQAYLMKPLAIRDLAPIVRHVLDKTLSPLAE